MAGPDPSGPRGEPNCTPPDFRESLRDQTSAAGAATSRLGTLLRNSARIGESGRQLGDGARLAISTREAGQPAASRGRKASLRLVRAA